MAGCKQENPRGFPGLSPVREDPAKCCVLNVQSTKGGSSGEFHGAFQTTVDSNNKVGKKLKYSPDEGKSVGGGITDRGWCSKVFAWRNIILLLLTTITIILLISHFLLWCKVNRLEKVPRDNTAKSLHVENGSPYGIKHRTKRQTDDHGDYITQDQYLDEMEEFRNSIIRQTRHESIRAAINYNSRPYMTTTVHRLTWRIERGDVFQLTSAGRGLQVTITGYYYIGITALFQGRTSVRLHPSCSLVVKVRQPGDSYGSTDERILFMSRTQENSGLLRRGNYPTDTIHASSIFRLSRNDVLTVMPDNWSHNCRLATNSDRTHLDAFLLSEIV